MSYSETALTPKQRLALVRKLIKADKDGDVFATYDLSPITLRRYVRRTLLALSHHDPDRPSEYSKRYQWEKTWRISAMRKRRYASLTKISEILKRRPKAHIYD